MIRDAGANRSNLQPKVLARSACLRCANASVQLLDSRRQCPRMSCKRLVGRTGESPDGRVKPEIEKAYEFLASSQDRVNTANALVLRYKRRSSRVARSSRPNAR